MRRSHCKKKQNLWQSMAGLKSSSSYSSSSLTSPSPSSSSKLCACVQLLQDMAGFKLTYVRGYTATSMYATGLTMCVTREGWREERCPIWRTGGWRCRWDFQDLDICCEHDDGNGEGDNDHHYHHFHDHDQGISSLPN